MLLGSKTTSAFCKIRLPNFARDESSNHNSENCSEISAVTRFRICLELLHFSTFMFFTPPYCEVYRSSQDFKEGCASSTIDSPIIAKKTLPSYSNSSSSPQNSPTSHENSPSSLRNLSSVNRQLGKSASSSRLPLPVSMAVKKA